MLHETTISFIGSGVMAEAMIKGVLDQRLTSSDRTVPYTNLTLPTIHSV